MNIIDPEKYWIDNRCYRRNPSQTACVSQQQKFWNSSDSSNKSGNNKSGNVQNRDFQGSRGPPPGFKKQEMGTRPEMKPYVEEDEYGCDPTAPDEIDDDDDGYIIEQTPRGDFKTTCDNIPSQLYAVIIGSKGSTKTRIERDTKTKITVPRKQDVQGFIVIEGRTMKSVRDAGRRINLLTAQTRSKSEPTHFTCFPLSGGNITKTMMQLKEMATSQCGADPMLFLEEGKSHLTICVMVLFDQRERERAAELLTNVQKEIAQQLNHHGKITVRLQGLEIMNDDPSQVDILYAKCTEVDDKNSVLQKMADFVAKKFADSGLGKPGRGDHVKLHCTIMNSLKKAERIGQEADAGGDRDGSNKHSSSYTLRKTFDATLILKNFKDYDFGIVDITEIRLATRFTTGADGFYKCFRTVPL